MLWWCWWRQPVHHRHDGSADRRRFVDEPPAAPQLPVGAVRQPRRAGGRPARPLPASTTGGRAARRRRHDDDDDDDDGRHGRRGRLAGRRLETAQSSPRDAQLTRRHHRPVFTSRTVLREGRGAMPPPFSQGSAPTALSDEIC